MSITIIIIRNRKQELKLKGISQTLGRDASRVKADEEEEPSRRALSYLGKHKPCREMILRPQTMQRGSSHRESLCSTASSEI